MPQVPAVRGERLVRALERTGFKVAQISGSHHMLADPGQWQAYYGDVPYWVFTHRTLPVGATG
jgi:hypothetical protein